MDLGTVETKLFVSDPRGPPKDKSKLSKWDMSKGRYNNVQEVVLDVRQIWWNTARFNGMDHSVTMGAKALMGVFDKQLSNMPAEVSLIFTLFGQTQLKERSWLIQTSPLHSSRHLSLRLCQRQ